MQNTLYQQNISYESYSLEVTSAVMWGTVSKIVRRSEVRGYGTARVSNTDIRYPDPDLSANFMAAENPDMLK